MCVLRQNLSEQLPKPEDCSTSSVTALRVLDDIFKTVLLLLLKRMKKKTTLGVGKKWAECKRNNVARSSRLLVPVPVPRPHLILKGVPIYEPGV